MKIRAFAVGLAVLMMCSLALGLGRSQGDKKKVAEPVKAPAKQVKPKPPQTESLPQTTTPAQRVERPKPVAQPVQAKPVESTAQPVETVSPAPAVVDPDKVLATVNGVKITAGQVEPMLEQFIKRQLASLGPMGGALPPDAMAQLKGRARPRVVDMFIEQELIEEQLKTRNITITDEQLNAHIATLLEENNVTLEQIEKDMERNGQTMDEFRKQMRTNLGVQQLVETEMKGKVPPVDEAAAKKFYDENPSQFSTPEQVRASHILIKTEGLDDEGKKEARTRIDDLLVKVKAGEDFAELAKAHSGCPSSSKGGDLGFFDRTRMVPEFSEAAFKLKVGEVSEVVETKFGYHIIKVTEHKDPETRSFESEKGNIITNLTRRQQYEFWNKYRQELKDQAQIEYAEEIKEAMQVPVRSAQPVQPGPSN